MSAGGPAGRVIDGRFELGERLGGGGMGLVWRALDLELQREVALKEVRPPDPLLLESDPSAARMLRERVLREARSLARLQHPNVVTIHHIVTSAEVAHPWLVMELVRGGSLQDRLDRGTLAPEQAATIGRGVLAALRAAHAEGVLHRDVKPANVLLRTESTPVLTDFGIAAVRESASLTATGELIGSPDYIAPERIRGREGDPASDLWSLGMMLYVAVEGDHPLRRSTALATLAAVLDAPIPPPERAGSLHGVLGALLTREPGDRPEAEELDRLLADAESGAPTAHHGTWNLTPASLPATEGGRGTASADGSSGDGRPHTRQDAVPGGAARRRAVSPQGPPRTDGGAVGSVPGPESAPTAAAPRRPVPGAANSVRDGSGAAGSAAAGGAAGYSATDSGARRGSAAGEPEDVVPTSFRKSPRPPAGSPDSGGPSGAAPSAPPSAAVPGGQDPERAERARRRLRIGAFLAGPVVTATALLGFLVLPKIVGDSGSDSAAPTDSPSSTPPPGGSGEPGGSDDDDAKAPDVAEDAASAFRGPFYTEQGAKDAVRVLREASGGTRVIRASFHDSHISADTPLKDDPKRYDRVSYHPANAPDPSATPGGMVTGEIVDLGKVDWSALPSLWRRAEQDLNVDNPQSRYLIVDHSMSTEELELRLYLSDEYGGGYLAANAEGKVVRLSPR
ncbi:serine/threonine protein kinase [Streptomyces sp. XM4193]|uniref:serine/threonine-protein kinase n=1 Tax=Streptomyces sp. XM4193 TaxID=2929782 RepID=UPI001FF8B7F1|nr:serine/threonine-protein kinase [Streptomyces sp. XM4193]MCK1798622.1 serine/threonine protein kinase [Streptomyces sp. XM4193]